MPDTIMNLAAVALTTTETAIVTAPSSPATSVVIQNLRVTNTTTSDKTVTLRVQGPSGSPAPRHLAKAVTVKANNTIADPVAWDKSSFSVATEITLSPGYQLLAAASATGVHCIVSGLHRA